MNTLGQYLKPTRQTQDIATVLAIVVRNAMEDFHCRHLSDAQMKELNPIIRNAICTGLHALEFRKVSGTARAYIDYHVAHIPKYWEKPELLPGFPGSVDHQGASDKKCNN